MDWELPDEVVAVLDDAERDITFNKCRTSQDVPDQDRSSSNRTSYSWFGNEANDRNKLHRPSQAGILAVLTPLL